MLAVRKQHVTLMEILIVMAILTIVSGAVAIGLDKALVDQRFRNEVSMIVDELRRAQDIMMIMDINVEVKFAEAEKNKGIDFWLETESKLSRLHEEVFNKKKRLKTIRGVFFRDPQRNIEGAVDLKFFSRGAVMSKGVMRLSLSGDDNPPSNILQTYICLPGYPRPIVTTDDKDLAESICKAEDSSLNDLLTRDTMERLPENVKQPSVETPETPQQKEGESQDKKNTPNMAPWRNKDQPQGKA